MSAPQMPGRPMSAHPLSAQPRPAEPTQAMPKQGPLTTPQAGGGLPAYTMPPSTPAHPAATPAPQHPFGVGGPASITQPFGATHAPTAQVSPPPADPPAFDPAATSAVPQQRGLGGTVYGTGGYPSIDTTMPVSTNPVENSGSLTGHILAQGWRDEIVDRRRSNIKVAIAMLVVLGLLVTVSVVFLFTAGSAFTDMISGMFS